MRLPIIALAGVLLSSVVPALGQKPAQSTAPKPAPSFEHCFKIVPAGHGGCPVGEDIPAETPLLEGLRHRDVPLVKKLIAEGADVNQADSRGFLPLLAAASGDFELMEILLKAGADVNRAARYGTTVLHDATSCSAAVRRFLEAGADPNALDINRRTPLISAASNQNIESVKLLVKAGSDVAAVDGEGMTPLLYAFKAGNDELIRYFTNGFDEKVIFNEKVLSKALYFAIYNSKIDQARFVLAKGSALDSGREGRENGLGVAVQKNNPEIVKLLLDSGAKVNLDNGYSPIYWAAHTGHVGNIKLLLDAGAVVDEPRRGNYWTPLIAAARLDHVEAVKLLLDAGAQINRPAYDGLTALAYAAHAGKFETVKLLLERGADPNIKNDRDWSALVLAKANNHRRIEALLIENGARQ
ncbi:MAG: ankyrin repeat domain-containing protein [Pyrinomonadaceae bacterium]